MKYFKWVHILLIELLVNFMAFYYTDVFVYNQTYIGNVLGHPFYLCLWTISSIFGLYYYSKIIFDSCKLPYHSFLHALIHIGMTISIVFPYQDGLKNWTNNLHVWIAGICIIGFIIEWIYIFSKYYFIYQKECFIFLMILMISLFIMLVLDHITSICEIFFTYGMNIFLFIWANKKKNPL